MLHRLIAKNSHDSCPSYQESHIISVKAQEHSVDPRKAAQRIHKCQAILTYAQQWVREVIDDESLQAAMYSPRLKTTTTRLLSLLEDHTARWNLHGDKLRPTAVFFDCFCACYESLNKLQYTIKELSKGSISIANEKKDKIYEHISEIEEAVSDVLIVFNTIPRHRSLHGEDFNVEDLFVNDTDEIEDESYHPALPLAASLPQLAEGDDVEHGEHERNSSLSRSDPSGLARTKDILTEVMEGPSRNVIVKEKNRVSLQARLKAGRRQSAFSYMHVTDTTRQSTPEIFALDLLPGIDPIDPVQDVSPKMSPIEQPYDSAPHLVASLPITERAAPPSEPCSRDDDVILSGMHDVQCPTLDDWEKVALVRRATLRNSMISMKAHGTDKCTDRFLAEYANLLPDNPNLPTKSRLRRENQEPSQPLCATPLADLNRAGSRSKNRLELTIMADSTAHFRDFAPLLRTPTTVSSAPSPLQTPMLEDQATPSTPLSRSSSRRKSKLSTLHEITSTEEQFDFGLFCQEHYLLDDVPSSLSLDKSRSYSMAEFASVMKGCRLAHDGVGWKLALSIAEA